MLNAAIGRGGCRSTLPLSHDQLQNAGHVLVLVPTEGEDLFMFHHCVEQRLDTQDVILGEILDTRTPLSVVAKRAVSVASAP